MANSDPIVPAESGDNVPVKSDPVEEVDSKHIKEVEDNVEAVSRVEEEPVSPDPYYPPIIFLPEVVVNSGEDGEVEIFKRRAKLYRYAHECSPPEWKERGTGDVKILKNEEFFSARIIMRREKTMKVCANHSILPWMEMRPNCGNKKSWVWKAQADFADEEPKQETLAIKFGTIENAKQFEDAFMEARKYVLENEAKRIIAEEEAGIVEKEDETDGDEEDVDTNKKEDEDGEINEKLSDLKV